MTTAEQILTASTNRDYSQLIQKFPYARVIGMQVVNIGKQMMFVLPPHEEQLRQP